jgi:hypothetical protein
MPLEVAKTSWKSNPVEPGRVVERRDRTLKGRLPLVE